MPSPLVATLALIAATAAPESSLTTDVHLMRSALRDLHPGLTRYRTLAQEEQDFNLLLRRLEGTPTVPQAHAAIAEYLAGIRCGHTFLNPLNQPEPIQQALYDGPDKLPFLYRWVGSEMIVTAAAPGSPLRLGDSIRSIAGVPIRDVQASLMRKARADGGRDETRRYMVSLRGAVLEEADAWLPLIAPPQEGKFSIQVERDSRVEVVSSPATTRQSRGKDLGLPETYDYDAAWRFEMKQNGLGVLTLPHFITWRMKPTWAKVIRDAFKQVKEANGTMLIDLRGCEGGSTDPLLVIAQQILDRPFTPPATQTRTAFKTVPESLRPLVETWDQAVFDLSAKVVEDGRPGFAVAGTKPPTYGPFAGAFTGRVFVAIDAANSSGGFLAAELLQATGRVTLMGQETGGSRRGLNAGQMFFLRLPHSGYRVDVPIYATFPVSDQPDQGIRPDIEVPFTRSVIRSGRDPILAEVERQLEASENGLLR